MSRLTPQYCRLACRLWIIAVLTDLTGTGSLDLELLDLMVSSALRLSATDGWS